MLWATYHTVSHLTVDVHFDVSEASLWAGNLAGDHKHPPLMAWIFRIWFSLFPRADWAAYLLAATITTATLAITWRLLRDYLDSDRALLGIAALMLVPLYTFQASRLNANTVMMPFWAATLLFYLRAYRNLRTSDAILAGLFLGVTFLGKYWAIYLVVSLGIAALAGSDRRRFFSSPAPYAMAAMAALTVAPPVYGVLIATDSATQNYLASSVASSSSAGGTVVRSIAYIGGSIAYVVVPLLFFAALRPSRAAIRDTLWPADTDRQQAMLVFIVPLLLPATANLLFPHRLVSLWTFPNWALLPVVLFGSQLLQVSRTSVERGAVVALGFSVAAVLASPIVAYQRLHSPRDPDRAHARQVAQEVRRLAGKTFSFVEGSDLVVRSLPFYLPDFAFELQPGAPKAGAIIVCAMDDAPCLARTQVASETKSITLQRHFLGWSGPPATYRIALVPAP